MPPEIDVSTLGVPELRRLLQVAEARQQHGLEQRLRAELATRSARAGVLRQPASWSPTVIDGQGSNRPDAVRPRVGSPVASALAAASIAAAIAFGAGLWMARTPARSDAPPAPLEQVPSAPPVAGSVSAEPTERPAAKRHEARSRPARTEPRRQAQAGGCRLARSKADRAVCGSASLAAQDRRMRAAYDRALASGADRLRLDRGQALWRARRNATTDPARLRALYAERIRELERAVRRSRSGR